MADCSANRMLVNLANLGIEDKSVEEAWAAVELADKEKDVDDIKKVCRLLQELSAQLTEPIRPSSRTRRRFQQ